MTIANWNRQINMLKICSFRKLRQSEEDIFDKITFFQIWGLEYKYELKWKIKFGKLVVGGAWGVGVELKLVDGR